MTRRTIGLAARMRFLIVALLSTVAAAAGCGGDGGEPGPAAAAAKPKKPAAAKPDAIVEIAAPQDGPGNYRFDKKKLRTTAGLVEFRLDNQDTAPHNIRIQAVEKCCDSAKDIGGTETTNPKTKITGRVKLEPGVYSFVCSINSHHVGDGGLMRGKLIVE